MSLRFRLIFAGSCAVLAALVFLTYGNHVRAEAEQVRSEAIARYGGEVVDLVVANEALEPGDVVGEADVSLKEWVADLAPEGALTSIDDVVGREVSVPVAQNAPVTELAFRDSNELLDVPAGHVAVSIPLTDAIGVTRGVAQGTALIAYEVDGEGASLISSDIVVISAPAATTTVGASVQVTLAVASDDVSRVLAASARGDLRLALPAEDVDAQAEEAAPPEALDPGGDVGNSEGQADAGADLDNEEG